MGRKLDHATALYMEGIRDGRAREAVTEYTGARYTQHSTGVADGVEGFVAFFEPFLASNPDRDIRIVRGFEDGRYVFCQASQSLNGGQSRWVTTDLFDTDADDRIVEHWDVIDVWRADGPDGRSQVGGPTEVTDLDQTDANKRVVEAFVQQVLIGGNHGALGEYVDRGLVQHDLAIGDGAGAWVEDLVRREVTYREIFRLVGQGNFAVTYCKVDVAGEPHAVFDIFRLSGGRIVERWVNAEVVPDDTGNSGKF